MRNQRLLGIVSLAAALGLLTSLTPTALADNVVADDQIVQGNLCVGTPCVDGEAFLSGGAIKLKGTFPRIQFEDTDGAQDWRIHAESSGFVIADATALTVPLRILPGAPDGALRILANGNVGVGVISPSQKLHVRQDQNANTFALVQNATNGLNANAVVRTQADTAVQNSQSHASSRTLKQDIRPLAGEAAVNALAGLEPVTFAYTAAPDDGPVGFIAEDVPELVATPGRQTLSALEIVAVLTKVVKEQQQAIQAQRLEYQRAIAELTARLATLEARP